MFTLIFILLLFSRVGQSTLGYTAAQGQGGEQSIFLPLVVKAPPPPGTLLRISLSTGGTQSNYHSWFPDISADGHFITFESFATNLVDGDTNQHTDIFVHDWQTGETTRVSVSSTGVQAIGGSYAPAISADGRFVAFYSYADNLVAGDDSTYDVFVHDRLTGQTTMVSLSSAGVRGDGSSTSPDISADGRFVAFHSDAGNLVSNDTNEIEDVFVHDQQTGQTIRISVSSTGTQGNDVSAYPAISADGRFVAFGSKANNLVAGDTNNENDIFVHDRQTGQTTRVSVSSTGTQGNDLSGNPGISADGRYVVFESLATNLVGGDTNGKWDVFVHDRQTGQTRRVSVGSTGAQGNGGSAGASISGDGRYITFYSASSNLVPGDSNIWEDIFVHDQLTGQTNRISVATNGGSGNGGAFQPVISGDGRVVAFESEASNLLGGDTNEWRDIFIYFR